MAFICYIRIATPDRLTNKMMRDGLSATSYRNPLRHQGVEKITCANAICSFVKRVPGNNTIPPFIIDRCMGLLRDLKRKNYITDDANQLRSNEKANSATYERLIKYPRRSSRDV